MNTQPISQPNPTEERRRQIMKAALACFVRKGYHKTTMDDIVAECGLSKGTLYWYFENKDDLFASLIKAYFFDVRQGTDAVLKQYSTASGKLRGMAQAFVEFFHAAEGSFSVLFEFWLQSALRDELNQFMSTALSQYRQIVAGVIAEGIQSGEFKAVNADQIALAAMAAFDGLSFYAMLIPDEVDLERTCQVFIETLLNGLMVGGEGHEQ
jgi:AcrR family transcriptional regulator